MTVLLGTPLRLRLVNDFQIVVEGLRAMLEPFSDRVAVMDAEVKKGKGRPADLTLYDTFGTSQADPHGIEAVLSDASAGGVVIFSWNTDPMLVAAAIAAGCRGYLGKDLAASQLVEQLERIGGGKVVVHSTARDAHRASSEAGLRTTATLSWPGQEAGLSEREAEAVSFIAQGYTNPEIAARMYISPNSLKTYIRSAYRKIGAERRAQAIRWGVEHGMLPPESVR